VKRGWITWDRTELPRAAFDARLDLVREHLAERDLPALAVYTDVWRSNRGRHFANFMPYWNRALLVIPRVTPPVLLCGLSPRVYPWIRSVTILDEIRPSPNLAKQLVDLCAEKGWESLGVLDLLGLPNDLYQQVTAGPVKAVNVTLPVGLDEPELTMYRHAAKLAREGLEAELASGVGMVDHEFTGHLERKFRRAGAEDLIILLTNGQKAPLPARGEVLSKEYSIALALEYRGHWVRLARSASERDPFPSRMNVSTLAGPYPYEVSDHLEAPSILSIRFESRTDGLRLFHGDTYLSGSQGLDLL
jgi:hypothetical protein